MTAFERAIEFGFDAALPAAIEVFDNGNKLLI